MELLWTATLPFALPSVNLLMHKHWRQYRKLADQMKADALICLKNRAQRLDGPVLIRYTVHFNDANHDADNFFSKHCTDTIVKSLGMLPSDSGKYVREVSHRVGDLRREECTVIEIFRDVPLEALPPKKKAPKLNSG